MKSIWIVTIHSTDNFEYPKLIPYNSQTLAENAYHKLLHEFSSNPTAKIKHGSSMDNANPGKINNIGHGWFIVTFKYGSERTMVELKIYEVQ